MYCIVEILTTMNSEDSDQGMGRVYGPFQDLDAADEAADQITKLSLNNYPGCEIFEMDNDDIEGDEFLVKGYSIETPDNDIKVLYLVKEFFAVAIPQQA